MNDRAEDEITKALIELIESAERRCCTWGDENVAELAELDKVLAEKIQDVGHAVLDNWNHLTRPEPKTQKQGTISKDIPGFGDFIPHKHTTKPIQSWYLGNGMDALPPEEKAATGLETASLGAETPDLLQEALDWCAERGLVFDFVNENAPDRIAEFGSDPRKVSADLYLDDRGLAREMFETYMLNNIEFYSGLLKPGNIIAVDFDGTLCRFGWPEIGEPNGQLIEMLLKAQRRGVRLTLWTCREHPASAKT